MGWAPRPFLYSIKTCSVLHQDLFCTLSRSVLYSIQICSVLYPDLFCTLSRPVLYYLDLFCTPIRPVLYFIQTCSVLHPDMFLTPSRPVLFHTTTTGAPRILIYLSSFVNSCTLKKANCLGEAALRMGK